MPITTEEQAEEMAKAMRLAINEAKLVLVEWADRRETEDEKLGFVILASVHLLVETIEAVMTVDDAEINAKFVDLIDTTLKPQIDKLRKAVS